MSARPSDLTERMLHLRQIPVGALLSPPVVRAIAVHLRERTFAAGDLLMRAGEPIDAFYLLTDGALDLRRDGAVLGELRAPQTLGFLGILARQDGPYDAVARSEVRAFELETDTLIELLEDHFELLVATIRYLAERLTLDMQELPEGALGLPPVAMGPLPQGPLDLVARVLLLRKISAFASANVNALAAIAEQMKEIRAPSGHAFWSAGDAPEGALFLLDGEVACRTADGRRFSYGPGTAVGGLEALCDRPRWYAVEARTPVVGLLGRTDLLLDIFEYV